MATQVSKASSLEQSGHWLQALQGLRYDVRVGRANDAEIWHSIRSSAPAFGQSLAGKSCLCNSVAVGSSPAPYLQQPGAPRELGRLNADEAERWVLQGLACQPLQT